MYQKKEDEKRNKEIVDKEIRLSAKEEKEIYERCMEKDRVLHRKREYELDFGNLPEP